jgi:tetratricopeptide (TPR) repeat protein
MMGDSFCESGQYEAARQVLMLALDEAREVGAELIEIDVRQALAALWRKQSEHPQAVETLTMALAIAQRHPTENREAGVRRALGQAYADQGQPELARREWERALVCMDHVADPAAKDVQQLLEGLGSGAEG